MTSAHLADHNFYVAAEDGGITIMIDRDIVSSDPEVAGHAYVRLIPHDAVVLARAILAAAGERA